MANYIGSQNNRYYVAAESAFGEVAAVTEQHRFPGVRLGIQQTTEKPKRRDKVGGRTFAGYAGSLRQSTKFELETYHTSWEEQGRTPPHGVLFAAAMGGVGKVHNGGAINAGANRTISFAGPHGLTVGQGIALDDEVRFVVALPSSTTAQINAPFSGGTAGAALGTTVSYALGPEPKSVTLYDYWSPETAVQRLLTGAAVDTMRLKVNGDFHEWQFGGQAAQVVDSVSFGNEAGLSTFPREPAIGALNYAVVPGHLGQVWLGSTPSQFYSLTDCEIRLENGVTMRDREFGSTVARGFVAGQRTVNVQFTLYASDEDQAHDLWVAARQREPVSCMVQLGQQSGQLCGVYLKAVVPEIPEFLDDELQLRWSFKESRAQGGSDDELFVAFG